MVRGIPNYGGTCWFGALYQCLRVTLGLRTSPKTFYDQHFKDWQGPNDVQEALLYIIDRLKLKEFEGETTQTIEYGDSKKSIKKFPSTLFLGYSGFEDLDDFKDDDGVLYKNARKHEVLTTVPEILVVSTGEGADVTMFGKDLKALIPWGGGHYIAFVKDDTEEWFMVDDIQVTEATPNLDIRYYLAFYV
jgi:ubiquitin C-terminal hydrolase